MLSCSGDNLTVPHDPNPSGDDILTTVGGHLDVHLSSIAFEFGGHVDVAQPISEVADFGLVGVDCSSELVDTLVGFGKPLVSDRYSSAYHADEAICNGVHSVVEVIPNLHVKDGLSRAGGDQGVVTNAIRGNAYAEWGW